LHQRSEPDFVTLAAVLRPFDLGDESEVDRILPGLGQLELVFPFDRVERGVLAALVLVLAIDLGEPVICCAITEAERRCRFAAFSRLVDGTELEVDFAFACGDRWRLHIIGRAGHRSLHREGGRKHGARSADFLDH
jgi:hypothetical protein